MAEQIAKALRALGVKVWWDEDMQGVDWQQELERQISTLSCVVVLWTPSSAESKNVRDEARLALGADKLVNAMAGLDQPPFPFDRVNGLRLSGWTGLEPHRGWTRLIETIEGQIVLAGGAQAGEITGALSDREQTLALKQRALTEAQEVFQDAQSRAQDAETAAAEAVQDHAVAETQLQRIAEMRGAAAILRAAQQELDTTDATQKATETALRQARAELSQAARGLSRAKGDLEAALATSAAPPVKASAKAKAPAKAKASKPAEPPPAPGPQPETTILDIAPRPATPAVRPAAVDAVAAPPAAAVPATRSPAALMAAFTRLGAPAMAGIGAGALAVVILLAMLLRGHGGAPTATAGPVAADVATAQAPPDFATMSSVKALAGDWAMEGLACTDPGVLRMLPDRRLLLITSGGETSTTTILSVDDSGVRVHSSDGDYVYKVVGDRMTMSPPGVAPMKLQRCAG